MDELPLNEGAKMPEPEVTISWSERKCEELLAKIRRSKYKRDCLADAKVFHDRDGYVMDVALAISWGYWGS